MSTPDPATPPEGSSRNQQGTDEQKMQDPSKNEHDPSKNEHDPRTDDPSSKTPETPSSSTENPRKRSIERTYETSDSEDETDSIPKNPNTSQDSVESLDATIGYTYQGNEPKNENADQGTGQEANATAFSDTIVTDTMLLSAEKLDEPGQPSSMTTPNSTLTNDLEDLSQPLFTSTIETPGMDDYPEPPAEYPEPPEPDNPEPPMPASKAYDRTHLRRKTSTKNYEALNSGRADEQEIETNPKKKPKKENPRKAAPTAPAPCTKCTTTEQQLTLAESEIKRLQATQQQEQKQKEQDINKLKTMIGKVNTQRADTAKELDKVKKQLKEEQQKLKDKEKKIRECENKMAYENQAAQDQHNNEITWGNKLQEAEDQINKLQQDTKDHDQMMNLLQKKLKEIQDEKEQLKDEKKQITERYQTEITNKDRTINNMKDTHQQEIAKRDKTINEINHKHQQEITSKNKIISDMKDKHQQEITYKNKAINELMITRDSLVSNLSQMQAQKKEEDQDPKQEKNKSCPLLLTDSNGLRSITKIQEKLNNNIQLTPAYTTKELKEFATNVDKEDIMNKEVLILCGTNHIRQGEKATEVAQQIQEATELLQQKEARISVVQIPPLAIPGTNKEALKLNGILEAQYAEECIPTDRLFDTRDILETDKIHLNEKGQQILADIICEKVTKKTEITEDPTKMKTYSEISVDNDVAGHIIGREGKTIQGLKSKFGVEINTRHRGDKTVLEITGTLQKIRETTEEIEQNAKKAEAKIQQRNEIKERRGRIVCRHFQKGKCPMGKQCDFRHSLGSLEYSIRTTTPTMEDAEAELEGAVGYSLAQETKRQARPRTPEYRRQSRPRSQDRERRAWEEKPSERPRYRTTDYEEWDTNDEWESQEDWRAQEHRQRRHKSPAPRPRREDQYERTETHQYWTDHEHRRQEQRRERRQSRSPDRRHKYQRRERHEPRQTSTPRTHDDTPSQRQYDDHERYRSHRYSYNEPKY